MRLRITVLLSSLMAFVAFFVTGCGGPSVEELIRQDIDTAFDDLSAGNVELLDELALSAGADFDDLGMDEGDFLASFLDGMSYEIGDIDVNDEEGSAVAYVTVNIKTLQDVLDVFSRYYSLGLSSSASYDEDELMKLAGTALMEAVDSVEPKARLVKFGYVKDGNGNWGADFDHSDFLDAIIGQ